MRAGPLAALARVVMLLAGVTALGRLAARAWLTGPDLDAPAPTALTKANVRPAFFLGIIDGLREDAVAAGSPALMPFWQELAGEGASGIAVTGEPTLTAGCVRTLLTGRNPDLAAAARNFNAPVVRENLVERLHDAGSRVGHAGDATAWQLARPWYVERDVLSVADQGPGDQGIADDHAYAFATEHIAGELDAITVHFTHPDHAAHVHGGAIAMEGGRASTPYAYACARADARMRTLVTAFRARHPQALVVLASDHGVTTLGTHGGGEAAARRAPFVAVGPLVTPSTHVEIRQAGLASTMAAWLRVAPLPFAESPPALELTRLLPFERYTAMDAYVRARIAIARTSGAADLADAIAARRARVSLDGAEGTEAALARFASEADALGEEIASTRDGRLIALALALATLLWAAIADVRPFRTRDGARRALVAACVAAFAALTLPWLLPVSAVVAMGALVSLAGREGPAPGAIALASISTFAVTSAAVFAVKPILESDTALEAGVTRLAGGGALLAGIAALALRARPTRSRLAERLRSSPGLLLVVLGLLVGFPTSLRPFLDPYLDLTTFYAAACVVAVALATMRPVARAAAPLAGPVAVASVAAALLWPHAAPAVNEVRSGVAIAAAGAVALLLAVLARRGTSRSRVDAASIAAGVALVAAAVTRGESTPTFVAYWIAMGAAIGALVLARARTGDVALAVRITAALALACLLERKGDDAVVRCAFVAAGAFAAARVPAPSGRVGLVGMAALVALVRIGAFHAAGLTESLSTIDTGAGIVPGLGTAAAPSSGITLAVVANAVVQAIRFALPWIVLLAAVVRAQERRAETTDGRGAHALAAITTGDVAALLAVRAVSMVVALPIWWRSSWWVSAAYAVFAFAAGDLLLVLACGALVGVFRRPRASGVASPAPARVQPPIPASGFSGSLIPPSPMPGSPAPGSAMPGSAMPGSAMPGSAMPGSPIPGSDGPLGDEVPPSALGSGLG